MGTITPTPEIQQQTLWSGSHEHIVQQATRQSQKPTNSGTVKKRQKRKRNALTKKEYDGPGVLVRNPDATPDKKEHAHTHKERERERRQGKIYEAGLRRVPFVQGIEPQDLVRLNLRILAHILDGVSARGV